MPIKMTRRYSQDDSPSQPRPPRRLSRPIIEEHGITPSTVRRRPIEDLAQTFGEVAANVERTPAGTCVRPSSPREEIDKKISEYELR